MIKFLFWNIHKSPLDKLIIELVKEKNIDVIILVESEIDASTFLKLINVEKIGVFQLSANVRCTKIQVFSRGVVIRTVYDEKRTVIKTIDSYKNESILLACTHFISKNNYDNESQTLESTVLADAISNTEDREGHTRTILVGDLNMNPFAVGVASARAIHGVMTKKIAQRKTRSVAGVEYKMFYNPMWKLLGNETGGPPGTLFYAQTQHLSYFWNIFDQVLIRSDLIEDFIDSDLEIVSSINSKSLLKRTGRPNAVLASDHLPIVFSLA